MTFIIERASIQPELETNEFDSHDKYILSYIDHLEVRIKTKTKDTIIPNRNNSFKRKRVHLNNKASLDSNLLIVTNNELYLIKFKFIKIII